VTIVQLVWCVVVAPWLALALPLGVAAASFALSPAAYAGMANAAATANAINAFVLITSS
jgi:hypothetical protein